MLFFQKNEKGAWLVVAMIGAYGLFDCIFSGLFSVDTSTAGTVAAALHNGGSAVGYTGFLLLSGVLTIIYSKYGSQKIKPFWLFVYFMYACSRLIWLSKDSTVATGKTI